MGGATQLWLHLLIILSFAVITKSEGDCVYTVYVRTGWIIKGGTDSIISITLYDANGWGVHIPDLVSWAGLMGPDHHYFERGNLDIFSGRGPCLTGPACAMNLTSDGSGLYHGWYCNYVEVTSTGAQFPCAQQHFRVEQWLAQDASPYQLTIIRNYCASSADLNIINAPDSPVVSSV